MTFFEQVRFCFLASNADAHLKNFSLIDLLGGGMGLAPAYDLVATALMMSDDPKEVVLTMNGRIRELKRADFEVALYDIN